MNITRVLVLSLLILASITAASQRVMVFEELTTTGG